MLSYSSNRVSEAVQKTVKHDYTVREAEAAAACSASVPAGEIESGFRQLHSQLESLDTLLARVRERFSPVLTPSHPAPPQVQGIAGGTAERSPLATELAIAAAHVDRLYGLTTAMLDACQL